MSTNSISPGPSRIAGSPSTRFVPYSCGSAHLFSEGLGVLDENTFPQGSLGPGNPNASVFGNCHIEQIFPAYNSASTPHTGNSVNASLNVSENHCGQTTVSPSEVDKFVNEFGIPEHRNGVHHFSQMTPEQQMVALFCGLMRNRANFDDIKDRLTMVEDKINVTDKKVSMNWELPPPQQTIIRKLVRHYLIQPQNAYGVVPGQVGTYLYDRGETVRMQLYKQDAAVREITDVFIRKQFNENKSSFRKAIFASVKDGVCLDDFAAKIVPSYHLPAIPKPIPRRILGALAMLRDVAAPLVDMEGRRGGDTGFWKNVDKKLSTLAKRYGTERSRLTGWEDEVIDSDNHFYGRQTVAASPAR
ncbi:hypothetical protein NEOLEDRAFT_1183222 [Neolentinus lepideus HHB14362 ss-1]|uniref:Uncharacterized protein n=1 Tax=Neolentinus lepideus HHB14362 ss-1 TaxID=1314782 RepID=A0A165NI47_9AGAM|nr:hypothetical protein NEOLEDRAFT_1183222 [Neolentinus lepideus HHB14362 ss-1]